MQLAWPAADHVPAAQFEPSVVRLVPGQELPAVHEVQDAWPAALKVPAAQGVPSDVRPVPGHCFPAVHCVQLA